MYHLQLKDYQIIMDKMHGYRCISAVETFLK